MKKPRLKPVPDFLTQYTEHMWDRTRACVQETGGIVPVMAYVRHGQEFSVPLAYEAIVQVGREMLTMGKAAEYLDRMGPEFGFLAIQLAERAADPRNAECDRRSILHEIGHTLHHVQPQAFFVSMPVRFIMGRFAPDQIGEVLRLGPGHPLAETAIIVIGRNPIRSYGLIAPFSIGDGGVPVYSDPLVLDSFDGKREDNGLFASIYDPSWN